MEEKQHKVDEAYASSLKRKEEAKKKGFGVEKYNSEVEAKHRSKKFNDRLKKTLKDYFTSYKRDTLKGIPLSNDEDKLLIKDLIQ